jgi:DNA-binding CsgD family transcriptional regulator/tetratricopeptide (TPR) repeat protein
VIRDPGKHGFMPGGPVAWQDVFIGRERELGRLVGLLATAGGGTAVAAVVAGDTGVGKSRLLQEFERRAAEAGALVMRGACVNLSGGVIPYAPLADALRRFGRQHGAAEVERLGGEDYTELRQLLSGTGPAVAGPPTLVFGAVLRLLDRIGEHQPLVLLFEDLHWADPSTVDLLTYLTRAMSTERVLVVGSAASDEPHGDGVGALLNQSDVEWVEVPRFTFDELRSFVEQSVPDPVAQHVLERCFELSGGNVFVASELLRAGVPAIAQGQVPARLRGLTLARIKALTEPTGTALKIAAVVGREVRDGLLLAVTGLDRDSLNRALHECVDRRLLTVDDVQNTFAFPHGLLREMAYGELLPAERREVHGRVAAAIDADHRLSLGGRGLADAELGYHWAKAGDLDRALPALIRAGDAERAARAFPEAATHYAQALELWDEVPDAPAVTGRSHDEVLAAAADAARWAGQVQLALDYIRQAIGEVDAVRDPIRAGELYERLGSHLWEHDEHAASRRAFGDAIRVLQGSPHSAALVRANVGLSLAEVRTGNSDRALALAEAAVEAARSVPDRAVLGRANYALGTALGVLGHSSDAIVAGRAALELAKETGSVEDLYRAYANLSVLYEYNGELAFSAEIAREGLNGLQELKLGQTRPANLLAGNLAFTLAQLGDWNDAAALIEEILANASESGKRYPRLTLAEIEVARGRFGTARRLLDALRPVPSAPDPRFDSAFYACEAELALWQGDNGEANRAVSAGLEAAQAAAEMLSLLRLCAVGLRAAAEEAPNLASSTAQNGHVRALMSFVARAKGLNEQGHELSAQLRLCETEHKRIGGADTPDDWAGLVDVWSALNRAYPAAYARLQEADAARRTGDNSRLESVLQVARHHAERLGAAPLLRRVDDLASSVAVPVGEPGPAAVIPSPRGEIKLTPRQQDVADWLVQGLTYQQIATRLKISPKTVNAHVEAVYRKLDVGSSIAATRKLLELGLVQ